jgi:outer membrane protein assembly factor BamD
MNRLLRRTPSVLAIALLFSCVSIGCANKSLVATAPAAGSPQPDKILYDRALNDYQHGRYTEARLSLQTLINSYPDSEYLAKAKLAVADSYYKEGGVEGLTQAVAEYKDFITFFPFLDEAAYAQMQAGMAHYRMMGKADRDDTQAQFAEQEFQTFLLKYPNSPLAPTAEQRLREVQEVLAEADFDVAHFYYVKGDYRAAASRLIEVTGRYPLFSQSDRALWMMGDIYRRAARGSKNEQERVRWRTMSDIEYARLMRNYPLSPLTADAKRQLTEDGVAIPPPDPQALARAQYDQKYAQDHPGMVKRALGMMKSTPNVSAAARTGEPDLNPPGEMNGPQDELQASGTTSSLGASPSGSGSGQSASIETVSPTESSSNPPASMASTSQTATNPPMDPPTSTGTAAVAPTPSGTAAPSASATHPSGEAAPLKITETATDAAAAEELRGSTAATNKELAAKSKRVKAAKAKPTKAPAVNKKKESTSKKKKGIHKLNPF